MSIFYDAILGKLRWSGTSSSGGSSTPFIFTATNYTALLEVVGMQDGDLAYVSNSQGTSWLPGTVGGTYYPQGIYVYASGSWVSDRNAISYELYLDDARLDALEAGPDGFVFVDNINDLPTPLAGVITLSAETTYFFTKDIDLVGNRLVGGSDTVLLGGSSENATITSTGLGVGVPLFTTEWTAPIRHITFGNVDTAININGVTNAPVALDWTGVNFLNVPNIGTIYTCDNWIYSKGAFLNSKGLLFGGDVGTIGIDNSIFVGDGSVGDIINIDSSVIVSRRFRMIYSSVVAFGSTVGLNVSTGATIPTEGYVLDTINFSGGGTYTDGIDYLDNRVRWSNSKGITNTSEIGNYYMNNNATVTTISAVEVPVKISGTTTSNTINQKFTHTDNRLEYTGGLDRDFQVSATMSFTTGNNKVVGMYVAKNGSIIPSSEMYATSSASGRAESIHIQTILNMTAGDYIELWIENDTDSTNITVEFLNVIVKSLN